MSQRAQRCTVRHALSPQHLPKGSGYLMALVAVGISASMVGVVRAEDAVDPVNISGTTKVTPSAAVPSVAPKVQAPAAPAASPTVSVPATPAAPSVVAPESPTVSAPVVSPAATPAPAAPAVTETPVQAVTPVDTSKTPAPAATPPAATPVVSDVPPAPAPAPAPAPDAPAPAPAPVVPAVTETTPVVPEAGPSAIAATAPAPSETQPAKDGQAFAITGLKVNYLREHPQNPPIDQLMSTTVKLGVANDGYVAPRAGVNIVSVRLGDIGKQGVTKIYRSGIEAVYGQIVNFYNKKGIIGVFVVVDSKDIDAGDKDIRPADRQTLQMIVVTSRIKHIRTVTSGAGVRDEDRIDNPKFSKIKDNSPLQTSGKEDGRMDLLNRDTLDNYVLRLNRQPGRRVDVAVSGTDQPGEVDLDYLVAQNRPWYVYFQVSNTGTEQTAPWRERFGFVHNQVTGHDDNLLLDYVTAGFSESHTAVGSYDIPVFGSEYLRYRIAGTFNQFTASDVGQSLQNFTGQEWSISNELQWNIYQKRELFIDLVGGLKYYEVTSENKTSGINGEGEFFIPYAGVRLERDTDVATTSGSLNLAVYHTGTSADNIEGLGRAQPSTEPIVMQFALGQSAFLEPLLFPREFAAGKSTLAHEIYVSARGQWSFNKRLFPQIQDIAGGFYSVRGYPESVVAGDNVVIATGEYRLHIPRLLAVQSDPAKTPFLWDKSFRRSPSQAYGRPDWDLITRAFVDIAQVSNAQRLTFEKDTTLVGTGVGVELQYKSNLNLRVDWGIALTDVPGLVEAGSNRFHISATLLY